jgi:hypothetical protein
MAKQIVETIVASRERSVAAKQFSPSAGAPSQLDCRVASLLAMTISGGAKY